MKQIWCEYVRTDKHYITTCGNTIRSIDKNGMKQIRCPFCGKYIIRRVKE